MTGATRTVVAASFVLAALTGCGDDDDFDQVDEGELQRQTCVDQPGHVAVVEDDIMIACVTVEEYEAILKSQPDQVVQP